MAMHSSILAWRIPWTEDPGRLQSMGSQRIGQDLVTITHSYLLRASQVALIVMNLPAKVGDVRDVGSIPGSGRSPRGGNGNSLQYSDLENSMDGGSWWTTLHGVTKSQTQESCLFISGS